jgi:hypothetical protein
MSYCMPRDVSLCGGFSRQSLDIPVLHEIVGADEYGGSVVTLFPMVSLVGLASVHDIGLFLGRHDENDLGDVR